MVSIKSLSAKHRWAERGQRRVERLIFQVRDKETIMMMMRKRRLNESLLWNCGAKTTQMFNRRAVDYLRKT